MRTTSVRRKTVQMAATAASMALLAAACTTPTTDSTGGPNGNGSLGAASLTPGVLLSSNGSNKVTVGDATVTFPSSVTDATWSPDGSRIAYVDGDGNIATARPDGTGVIVLTAKNPGVVRSRPSWSREWIFYAEKKGDGTSALMSVATNGCAIGSDPATGFAWGMDTGDGTSYVDVAPSAAQSFKPSRVAFQHVEPSGPEIWINDTNQRVPNTYKVINGSEPALPADGKKLAYVGTGGQIFVTPLAGQVNGGVQITFGANQPNHLVWAPDGQHIAYRTATGIEQVSTSPSGNSNPPTVLSGTPGVPSILTATKNSVDRITGADPIALTVAASAARWPGTDRFEFGQGYLGAYGATISAAGQSLGAAGASTYPGPLLITSAASLDPRVATELKRIFGTVTPSGMKPLITIVGNEVTVAVDSALTGMGYEVRHANGVGPTSAGTGDCGPQAFGSLRYQTVIIVDAPSSTDNATATALAKSWAAPLLRLESGALSDSQKAYLARTAGSLEHAYLVDSGTAISADVRRQVGQLIGGPAGVTGAENPPAPALTNL